MTRKLATGSLALCLLMTSANAWALVTEPNGMVVPVDSQNGEVQLYTMFQNLGEPIDWQADGVATPNAFSPLCEFTATFVLHESACSQALAWYNETGQTPANSDLHVIIPAGSPLGQVFTGTDIKADPAYAGGLVGFAIVGDPGYCSENHHTNPSYNNMCSACSNPGPWITAVIYASKNTPNSYYVGFEDGSTNASSWNNDGDFNDDVFFITGVTCAGGGQPCDTGKPGVCAVGVTQCVTGGATVCKDTNPPTGEKCDALDNNCDGTVDEGDLCAAGLVCVKGKCVPKCGGGEFNCPIGKTCSNGYCIETACVQVYCPVGQVCVAGKCVGACDGVVCPVPQGCVAGVCLDACGGVTCPQGQVCENGACVTSCDCAPCGAGLACNAVTKHCTDPACATTNCPAGQFCQAGNCVDACTGAACPTGQACQGGQCIDIPSDGGTAGSGGSPYDGGLFPDTGAGGKKDASSQADGATDGGPQIGTHGGGSATGEEGGCGCRTAARTGRGGWLGWVFAVGGLWHIRRVIRRRTMRARFLVSAIVVSALLISACSDDSSSPPVDQPDGSAGAAGTGGTATGGHDGGPAGSGGAQGGSAGTSSGGTGATAGTGGSSGAGGMGIAEDRLMDWSVAGVPGGIPHSTTICATVTDVSQLQAAIDGCAPGGVVYVPTGVYALTDKIVNGNHHGVVVRGDGPGKTIFTVASGSAFSFGNADWPPPAATLPVVSGATRTSATITVDSTAATAEHDAFQVGGLIRVEAGVNPPFVHNIGVSSYDEGFSVPVRVTSLTDTTVTFEPPLPFDFSPYSPKVAMLAIPPLTGVGLEDFTIDLQGTASPAIEFTQAWGCWIQNVEIKASAGKVLTLYAVLKSEIRHCNLHDSVNAGPNTEGLDFYRDSAWNLIEDNIVYNAGGIIMGDWQGGNVGNVIAYNFAYATSSGDATVAGYDIDVNHGSNNAFNLLEGNIAGGVMSDGYFGSTSHDTLFRNWLTATHPTAPNNLATVKLKHFSDYFNVIGNVLGTPAFPTSGSVDGNGHAQGGFYDSPQTAGYDNGWSTGVQVLYEFGFPNMGNTGFTGTLAASTPIDYSSQGATLADSQALDLNVAATVLRHGNYDYFNKAIQWDPANPQHVLPASLFRSSKPAYFGSLAWPPMDPASPPGAFDDTTKARIPAGYRHVHGVDP